MDIGNKDNFIHDRDLRCDGNIEASAGSKYPRFRNIRKETENDN